MRHGLRGAPGGVSKTSGFSESDLAAWVVGGSGWWGGDDETPVELLVRMSALDASQAEIVPMRHPRMLHPAVVADLELNAPPQARAALGQVREFSRHAYAGTLDWPVGLGPLDLLCGRVMDNMVSLEHALTLAHAVGERGDLIAPYARATGWFAVRQAHDGVTGPALQLGSLLLSAARSSASSDDRAGDRSAWQWAAHAYVEIARTSLTSVPDDHLFWAARGVVDEILRRADGDGPAEEGSGWSLLGRYLLDIYVGDKDAGRYDTAYLAWQGRRVPSSAAADGEDARPMPEPVEAVREAVRALRRAVDVFGERRSAVEWKALVQAQHALAAIDPQAAEHGAGDDERLATARIALARLDPVRDADKVPFVEAVLGDLERDAGQAEEPPRAAADGRSLAQLAQETNAPSAITAGLMRFHRGLRNGEPGVHALLAEIDALAPGHCDEGLWRNVLDAHVDVLRARLPPGMTSADGPLGARLALLERLHEGSSPGERADALVGLAATSGGTDEEGVGLQLVGHAVQLDPSIFDRHRAALGLLIPGLEYREACNLGAAGRISEAIARYATAAVGHARCGLPSTAKHCLGRIAENAALDTEAATATVIAFLRHALELERSLDADASTTIAETLAVCSARLQGTLAAALPLLRDEVAKGLRFAAAVASPSPLALDERARQLLEQVAHLEQQVAEGTRAGAARAGAADSALDDEAMLVSFVAPSEATPGRSTPELLLNVQRGFDEHLARARYGAGGGTNAPFVRLEDLQSLLGDRTVLVSLYLGVGPDDDLTVTAQAFTRDSQGLAFIPQGMPAATFVLTHEGVQLTQSPVGLYVADLRRHLVEDPMFADVDADAREVLASELPRWLGPFAAQLAEWRAAGLDHLVVWPHGPLHYLPWHLFIAPGNDEPIAADWTVTVLPTVGTLVREPAPPGGGLVAVASAEGGRPYGLRSAASMPAQAAAIAAAYGTEPLAESTPERLLEALPGSRFVHIAAHGSHVEEAPAFQCIYLDPGSQGDGRLFAHHIAQLDLRGVELVTLSACESALGRFDVSDNLRGLPAALLAAGASAVVGAMWPVEPDMATTFFTTLYARLAAGGDRLAAFRDAQVATRRSHPEYRDWGAMSYVGDWREP